MRQIRSIESIDKSNHNYINFQNEWQHLLRAMSSPISDKEWP